jgi:hypothetical protein
MFLPSIEELPLPLPSLPQPISIKEKKMTEDKTIALCD